MCLCVCVYRVLCSTVKQLVAKLAATSKDDDTESISSKCSVLNQKLDALIRTLHEESQAASQHLVVSLSVCLSVCLSLYLSVCLSVCISVCLSVCDEVSVLLLQSHQPVSVCLSVSLSVCLFILQ